MLPKAPTGPYLDPNSMQNKGHCFAYVWVAAGCMMSCEGAAASRQARLAATGAQIPRPSTFRICGLVGRKNLRDRWCI